MKKNIQHIFVPIFFLMCLSLVIPALDPDLNPSNLSCDRERKVLTDDYGTVSSGNKEYPMDSHCEWLIRADDERSYITLTFTKMDTECSYDHVYIYDGNSYASPLLGSFSGNTTPPMVTTTQGTMLILLYSDTNYVRNGFEAVYVVTDCPLNCSNRGMCQNHRCICDTLWSGDACDISLCPMDCGLEENRGACDMNGSYPPRCNCRPGFSGMDCSLPDSNKSFGNTWHLISSSGIDARAGHSGTYVQHTDSYYVFGGFTFKEVLGDTLVYSFRTNRWTNITSKQSPSARHGHTAVCYLDNIIIFGGEMANGTLSNELWFFNTSSLQWNLITSKNHIVPPPITKHSMTLVDFYWLYVIGGSVYDGTFSSKMYRINIRDMNGWEMVDTNGGKESNYRLVGHSAVYHQQTKTIFAFGGITAEYSHVSKLSNQIHAFHTETKYWIQVKYERTHFTPLERAFHSAAIVGDYMIIYGGYTHKHVEEEICYDNEFHLYHLKCHKWIDFSSLRKDFEGPSNPIKQGVFSHSMDVRRGHTLVIFGGYSGLMRSHLLAYVLPTAVLNEQLLVNSCSKHLLMESCLANLACGWCFTSNACIERKMHKTCSEFSADFCPGFCSALSDCPSCLIWGQSFIENVITDKQDPFPVISCSWCVPDMKCHSIEDTMTSCSSNSSSGGPATNSWWGSVGYDASILEECYTKDSPPGLVSVKYRHPVNLSQPDDVVYLHQASEEVLFRSEIQRYDANGMEENIVKFLGFLHPLNARPLSERMSQLRLTICSAGSNAVLKLSNDSTQNNLEVVASHSPRPSFYCSDVHRARGVPLFSDPSEGHKYLFDFTVRIPAYLNETSVVQLKWTAFSVEFEVIDHKHLELYKNGTCYKHSSCLSCLTDTLCGWCESNQQCYPKSHVVHQVLCQKNGKPSFLVIHPDNCSVCSDYIYCEHCTQMSSCEWVVEAAICVRRGRFRLSVQDPQSCPVPCPLRPNCLSCLNDPGMCAWCEETQTCFLFSTYTSSYSYGRCRDWVDENRAGVGIGLCRNCSKHSQCSTCIKDLTCGWCSSSSYPGNGICTDGDFSGPFSGSCSYHLKNSSVQENLQWSYGQCPDLEECLWDLHDCDENATCHNTPESYTCECNVGFEGDGRTCTRACAVKCVNGYCSNAPYYVCICDLGWTGEDCSINCGCNNHSTCTKEVGICDECQDWTEGNFCEKCSPGSYGDAKTSIGCQKCNCNGHGDNRFGYCNTTSGICFCLNNTVGPDCSVCKEGYYGNPQNNGKCFEECHPRKVITNAVEGRFGSPAMSSESEDCLWLLTVHSVLDMQSLLGPMQSTGTYLQVKIHKDINIPCPHNHIYIYDGLPNFVASDHPNTLLGSFCGTNLSHPIVATAASGYLTIHFKRGALAHGFNASYTRLPHLPNCCDDTNADNNCTTCSNQRCPNNCSNSLNQGQCIIQYGICVCNKGYAGEDCSLKLSYHTLAWKTLFNLQKASPNNMSIPPSRVGSSLLTYNVDHNEHLLLFGGYSSAAGYLNDLFLYNTTSHLWIKILTDYAPPNRHFHAAASLNQSLYVYGGLGEKTVLGDFWVFTSEHVWVQLPEVTTSSAVLSMAGSTLTPVTDNRLVLFGGFSPSHGFFERVIEFDTENRQWLVINSTGAKPIGLYGHSSVYHSDTESIYIFGGISYDLEHVAPCNYLYAFHYPSSQWFRLPPDNKVNKLQTRPLPRYFHTLVVRENYLIILGGRGNSNSVEEAAQPFAYVFSCNLWIPLTDEAIEVVGKWPEPLIGASATVANDDVYFYGGTNGKLYKLSFPSDICLLFSSSRVGCMQQTGCAFCSLTENGINQTLCFSQDKHSQSKCYNPKEASKFIPSVTCNTEWLEKRSCHQYTSCSDCVASWPSFKRARQVCQWCSNCRTGRCVASGSSCEDDTDCNIPRKVVTHPNMCPLRVCGASDCEKCGDLKMCIWTRQVHRSSGFGLTLNKMPIYNWVCVMKEIQSAPSFPIESMPPLECPASCFHYSDCTSCLRSQGGEGGWHQCVWSEDLQSCMSPSFELLACEDGTCGLVVSGNESSCPLPCWEHFQASHCLAQANCGWCAFSGPKVDGRGLCMDGGIMGATGGICRENQVLLLGVPMPMKTLKWFQLSEGPPTWTYLVKPPENECENGHHNCDNAHEECVDTLEGFECHCKPGYKMQGKKCIPICKQGCVNGTCVQPDECKCNFGFVGNNCSIMCKCNGHSDCPSPEELDICLECKNNTFGKQCQKCKPLYVGNPINGGQCVSCYQYCNTHSGLCFSSDLSNITASLISNQSYIDDLVEKLVEGPIDNAFCIDCRNNTQGKRCNDCIPGYFKAGEHVEDGCRPCECHGHGDMCNPVNGENCNCQNNTENDRQCSQKNIKNMLHMTPCWQLQCSKCKEYFLGSPANSHQCYRHMYLDKEYCFDPSTQGDCNRIPNPLHYGQTVFFAVQPRYMNVDIRIVVDVTSGGVDFFLSAKEDAFIVEVEKPSGLHQIYIDGKYGMYERDMSQYETASEFSVAMQRKKREEADSDSGVYSNITESSPTQTLHPKIGDAEGLTTYIDVKKCEDFLYIRNLENRLIVTIPQEVHDLRTTRFYMILRGAKRETFGSLFFRQDQTRIDLFVFFSVFFSCFFLFLAGCVVCWKIKQAFDVRRARRLHAAEMKHMASRPFGHILTIIDDEPDDSSEFFLCSPSNYRKKLKYIKAHGRDSPKLVDEKLCLRPLAVEPLSDGYGAITTILVQLPGGAQSVVRMTLASSLITSRSSHYHLGCGLRAAMRRRTSHANV
ncbi:multiple epidermal growth factor-like domains protein 8 [Parasteatoda tepidariorum]|uniref:multiple epidermal growth factor-like domains protein 8 n=1 Tax=Parasteatoda tepidariorum TaxID=114398 RepID=UPI00077F9CF3|nr:multiple epidermal growth factor-like domains protein 8 [Parasteatoda tepidariorum]XP_042899681.1 multiple epidermal growth factor-like domains protein 8 [Parasteatoda tepidariorum]